MKYTVLNGVQETVIKTVASGNRRAAVQIRLLKKPEGRMRCALAFAALRVPPYQAE
jgi:hypothetical protein